MATLLQMLDDLRDRLNDPLDAQVPRPLKVSWINYGIRATWPSFYTTARDTSLSYVVGTYDYTIPSSIGVGQIVRVEVESGVATNYYTDLENFEVIPDVTQPILSLIAPVRIVPGARFRITAAKQLSLLTNDVDVYNGPLGSEELPVLYAMGIAVSRRLEDRQDYRRMSTTLGQNGVDPADLMEGSNYWFSQFFSLLDQQAMPLPYSGA